MENERITKAVKTTVPDAAGTMRTIIATIIAVFVALLLNNTTLTKHTSIDEPDKGLPTKGREIVSAAPAIKQDRGGSDSKTVIKPSKKKIVQPVAKKPASEPSWEVKTSPHSLVDVATINRMLAHLEKKGLSKEGAAYLTGNFIGESHLVPCGNTGDGGQAMGFGQWHPSRRYDMPCGFIEQLDWAIDVEMPRDSAGSYPCLCEALKTANIPLIMLRTQQWERWGVLGARWIYANNIYSQL